MIELKTNGQMLGGFPVVVVSLDDYTSLPVLENVPPQMIERMPIGYQFRFPGANSRGVCVVAEVVEFGDVLCDQWGSSVLYTPDRWVNRYAAIFKQADESSK